MKVNHLNALLVEIMMAVLFFSLAAVVILELFVTAGMRSGESELRGEALSRVQNLTQRLYAAEDAEALLEAEGFGRTGDGWTLDGGEYVLTVATGIEPMQAGGMMTAEVTASGEGGVLASLPVAKYLPGEVAP